MISTLLSWYDVQKRDLPWRDTQNPYHVFVSEIMLQQTGVDMVKEFFPRFIVRFPDLSSLTSADEEELLLYWQGLGYYSRALRLKKAAEEVQEKYGGAFPREVQELLHLPGVGPYTAGALASILYDVKTPAIDGNVERIFARIFLLDAPLGSSKLKKEIRDILLEKLPEKRSGDFNQALMDLGALICRPKNPLCSACPLQPDCLACQKALIQHYPRKNPRKTPALFEKTLLIIEKDQHIALVKKSEGLLKQLWQLPLLEGRLTLKELERLYPNPRFMGEKKHYFSHQSWKMRGYCVEGNAQDVHWVSKEDLKNYPMGEAFLWLLRLYLSKDNEN